MSGRRGTLHLQTVDELLGAPVAPAAENSQVEIPVDKIVPFEHHPFKVLDDEKMADLVKSIRGNGVLTPVIVRPDDADGYEMISGHRRLHASKLAGLTMIPAIVKPMTDDEATIAMVDSNMQREEILPSERAFALKMKMDAMRRRGYRSDLAGEADAAKVAGMSDIATVKNQGDFETCGREVHKSDEGDQEVTCGHKVHKSEENQPEEILSEQDNHKPEDSERKFVNDMYEVSDQTSTCGLEVHKFSESRTRDAIGKENAAAMKSDLSDEQKAKIQAQADSINEQYDGWFATLSVKTANIDSYITASASTLNRFKAFIQNIMSEGKDQEIKSKRIRVIDCIPVTKKKVSSPAEIDVVIDLIKQKLLAELENNDEIHLD